MNVTCIRYGRKLSDGDYGSESLELECAPGDESVEQALAALKKTVLAHLLEGKGAQPLDDDKKTGKKSPAALPIKIHEPEEPAPFELPDDANEWLADDWADYMADEAIDSPQQLLDLFQEASEISDHYENADDWNAISDVFGEHMNSLKTSATEKKELADVMAADKKRFAPKKRRARRK